MTEENGQFDQDPGLEASSRLTDDLQALLKPQHSVPPEIDRAVLDRANRHFSGREFAKTRPRYQADCSLLGN